MNDILQLCARYSQRIPKDRHRMVEKNSVNVCHPWCWYEMKTGRPIGFPEHEIRGRMIRLVQELERQEGHGESM
jgi:hypothetical protein